MTRTQDPTRWAKADTPREFWTAPVGFTIGPALVTHKVRQKSFYAQ